MTAAENQFIITKRIAKHGKQAIIVVPSILAEKIRPSMLVRVQIDIIEEGNLGESEDDSGNKKD